VRRFCNTLVLVAFASLGEASAQELTDAQIALLLRKLQLGTALLQRMEAGKAAPLQAELASLRSQITDGDGRDLPPLVDNLIARISEQYRNRRGRSDEQGRQLRVRYEARKAELASFKEGYEALLTDRQEAVGDVLDRATYDKRLARAEELVVSGSLEAAYAMLDSAYRQLLHAIKRVRDRQTVEYRLNFASAKEEYEYEQRRYRSQQMLLDMTVRERPPDGPMADRIRDGMAKAASEHHQADVLAGQGRFAEALAQEESATEDLAALLRLMGYFF
jgi:hypothetical protein